MSGRPSEPALAGHEFMAVRALWEVKVAGKAGPKAFVHFQRDVMADDVRLAYRKGFESVVRLAWQPTRA
jgi:hypothetical protein